LAQGLVCTITKSIEFSFNFVCFANIGGRYFQDILTFGDNYLSHGSFAVLIKLCQMIGFCKNHDVNNSCNLISKE